MKKHNQSQYSLLEFYSDGCKHCKKQNKIFEHSSIEELDNLNLIQINTKTNPDLTHAMSIHSVPTFVLIENKHEVARIQGYQEITELKQLIHNNITDPLIEEQLTTDTTYENTLII